MASETNREALRRLGREAAADVAAAPSWQRTPPTSRAKFDRRGEPPTADPTGETIVESLRRLGREAQADVAVAPSWQRTPPRRKAHRDQDRP